LIEITADRSGPNRDIAKEHHHGNHNYEHRRRQEWTEQRKRILQEIALVTGAQTIGEGIDLQLRNVQVSDLGLARKITVDKNHTVVEGRTKDRRLSLEPESCAQASVYTSPAQSA